MPNWMLDKYNYINVLKTLANLKMHYLIVFEKYHYAKLPFPSTPEVHLVNNLSHNPALHYWLPNHLFGQLYLKDIVFLSIYLSLSVWSYASCIPQERTALAICLKQHWQS